jgi:hypothetical protein
VNAVAQATVRDQITKKDRIAALLAFERHQYRNIIRIKSGCVKCRQPARSLEGAVNE